MFTTWGAPEAQAEFPEAWALVKSLRLPHCIWPCPCFVKALRLGRF